MRRIKKLTGEMTQWLGRLSGFVEDQTSILSLHLSWLRAPVSEDPMHSSLLCGHTHSIHTYTQTNLFLKKNTLIIC